jgi:sulfur carrier protein
LQVLINGEATKTTAQTLAELCTELGFADAKVATAVNGSFVAASLRGETRLEPSDEIEIVAPRQGG